MALQPSCSKKTCILKSSKNQTQQNPPKLNVEKSILGKGKEVGDGEKENKDIVSELAAHYLLIKMFQSILAYFGMTFFFFFDSLNFRLTIIPRTSL